MACTKAGDKEQQATVPRTCSSCSYSLTSSGSVGLWLSTSCSVCSLHQNLLGAQAAVMTATIALSTYSQQAALRLPFPSLEHFMTSAVQEAPHLTLRCSFLGHALPQHKLLTRASQPHLVYMDLNRRKTAAGCSIM